MTYVAGGLRRGAYEKPLDSARASTHVSLRGESDGLSFAGKCCVELRTGAAGHRRDCPQTQCPAVSQPSVVADLIDTAAL